MGHGLKECQECDVSMKDKINDDLPYSLALKAELSIFGKESSKFGLIVKKAIMQRTYTGNAIESNSDVNADGSTIFSRMETTIETAMEKLFGKKDEMIDTINLEHELTNVNIPCNPKNKGVN